ncbi:DUF6328 family protein [Nocardia cyriacigeorgica]|uniref:DUF6328 family protein n=1 Tax=Nocardia cyriacigeorgica TaxID=135487 RepID=UPI001E2F5D4C|nr:DUF6328 family protein [Nocardia cyriacigeorgica]
MPVRRTHSTGNARPRRPGHRRGSTPAGADHDTWNWHARAETPTQRLDRNWAHLLQELRVLQTGVQLLTGFLMILPFQSSFDALDSGMRAVYLVTAGAAVGGTIFLVAPVSWHRLLFRRHRLQTIVTAAHRCTLAGLALLGVAMCGVTTLIVDVVVGPVAAIVTGVATAVVFVVVWLVAPMRRRLSVMRGDAAPRNGRRAAS